MSSTYCRHDRKKFLLISIDSTHVDTCAYLLNKLQPLYVIYVIRHLDIYSHQKVIRVNHSTVTSQALPLPLFPRRSAQLTVMNGTFCLQEFLIYPRGVFT